MTRTDVVASSRPQTAGVKLITGSPRRPLRRRFALPVALLLVLALLVPTAALAAGTTGEEGLSGYNETKTSTGTTTPAPAKETEPTTSTEAKAEPKAATLPFTGFNLTYSVVIGIVLVGAGFSIVLVQRRQSQRSGS